MSHPEEKQKLDYHQINDAAVAVVGDDFSVASFDDLIDVLPNILGFLPPEDIMCSRRVCKNCREAATKTIVPLTNFRVRSMNEYNAMGVMTRALPNLQQIHIGHLEHHKYNDGEDPDEEWAAITANHTTHDIEIISNFSKLRYLTIHTAGLNGRYPLLFNSYPLLQKLRIQHCEYLKWDLEMLAGFPLLKELDCAHNYGSLTGGLKSLRVLKGTLEKVHIRNCVNVEGNFMDLADFPHLKVLNLCAAVTGDIRDINANDFSALECLDLPKGVYGGRGYEFQRISDGPDLVRAVYLLNKQRPTLKIRWYHHLFGKLSEDSPDWYESVEGDPLWHIPPFRICIVKAGSRIGYRWESDMMVRAARGISNMHGYPCEVNWLDPEPDRESSDYDEYIEELQKIERQRQRSLFRGFHQPPTEEQFIRLCEEYHAEIQSDDEDY